MNICTSVKLSFYVSFVWEQQKNRSTRSQETTKTKKLGTRVKASCVKSGSTDTVQGADCVESHCSIGEADPDSSHMETRSGDTGVDADCLESDNSETVQGHGREDSGSSDVT